MTTNLQAGRPPIADTVRDIVAKALGTDPAKVLPHASLIQDLGADSLDFLDIVFKLEVAFGIQITRGQIEQAARGDMSAEDFAPDGVVSEAGLARLRELMPEAAGSIQVGLHQGQILTLFTVRTFEHLVEGKLAERPAA
jgi:acyl carrier protein